MEDVPGVMRGWRRPKGRHAQRRTLRELGTGVALVGAVVAAAVGASAMVARAGSAEAPAEPYVKIAPDTAPGLRVAVDRWIEIRTRADHGAEWDMWTDAGQVGLPREVFLRAMACKPPPPPRRHPRLPSPAGDPGPMENIRVASIIASHESATIWYWGEAYVPYFGVTRLKAIDYHVFHVMEYEDGAWRAVPRARGYASMRLWARARLAPCSVNVQTS